eukprot:g7874.t1
MRMFCGIESWSTNSFITHATSDTPRGAFEPAERPETFPVFSHEPTVTRGPAGEYVMFFVANQNQPWPIENCTARATGNGAGPKLATPSPTLAPTPAPTEMYRYRGDQPTYMAYAPSPGGPWSTPVQVIGIDSVRNADSNLAAAIYSNGSLVGLFRTRTFPPATPSGSSRVHLVTASDWKDPASYITHEADLFPGVGYRGLEDMHVYFDARGGVHSLFHHMDNATCPNVDDLPACGGHAFSADGTSWTYGGVAFGREVEFTDGGSFAFERRERPHFIFDADGTTPVALTSGVQYGDIPFAPLGQEGATYTLLQPVQAD